MEKQNENKQTNYSLVKPGHSTAQKQKKLQNEVYGDVVTNKYINFSNKPFSIKNKFEDYYFLSEIWHIRWEAIKVRRITILYIH